tara:strand:+ start:3758 stop:4684 length:927 start_codon:yes stop_codon:yes gene_type:complete
MSESFLEFNIKEFDMSKVGHNKCIIFIGKRGTGKSILVLDYLRHNQDLPIGTCVSPTEEFNKTFSGKIPQMFIHEEFTPELLEKFVHRQKIITKRKQNDSAYRRVDHRAFLIFDDCLYDAKNWANDKNMRFIFMNGRHVGITFLLTMQYLLGIPPNLRANVDYIFICKETKTTIKKKLHQYYAGMFPTYEMFNQVLNECTKDYGCMVIDNTTGSDKLEDQVFWYKAKIDKVNNFKLCDPVFWNATPRTDIIEDPEDEMIRKQDFSATGTRRKRGNLTVHRLTNGPNQYKDPRTGHKYNNDYNPQRLYR